MLNVLLILTIMLLLFVAVQVAWLRFNGTPIPRPDISREPVTIGSGPALKLLILGDSTAVSQGSAYEQGYAVAIANHLSTTHTVTYQNLGVSGARAADVAKLQAPQAASFKPDIAVVAVGANDITHLTHIESVRTSLIDTIRQLRAAHADVRIIVTGAPDMGSPPRIPQPLRWLAGERTIEMNDMVLSLVGSQNLTFAPIADETGPAFRRDHTLFAADNFHPNANGYKLWNDVLVKAVDTALTE